jgi:hypothetical protein
MHTWEESDCLVHRQQCTSQDSQYDIEHYPSVQACIQCFNSRTLKEIRQTRQIRAKSYSNFPKLGVTPEKYQPVYACTNA